MGLIGLIWGLVFLFHLPDILLQHEREADLFAGAVAEVQLQHDVGRAVLPDAVARRFHGNEASHVVLCHELRRGVCELAAEVLRHVLGIGIAFDEAFVVAFDEQRVVLFSSLSDSLVRVVAARTGNKK